jgi:hypothetical protein
MLKGTLQRNTFLVYFRSASEKTLTQNMNDFRAFLQFFSTVVNSKIKKESIPYNPTVISRHIGAATKRCILQQLYHKTVV